MIDKADFRVPFSANFNPDFRFINDELKYAGVSGVVIKSQYYQGTCDLRPFGIDAVLHAYYKRKGARNHKLEILDAGGKSLEEIGQLISCVFDVDVERLELMRIDFAADMFGVPVLHLHDVLRVKFKRSSDERGELDYEVVGGRRLEYFRYGKAPNCIRVYDKPAECKSRLAKILKRANPDAEPPTFSDIFGFPEDTIMTRVERQAGGGRPIKEIPNFRALFNAGDYDPFKNLVLLSRTFSFPDPRQHGDARTIKILGIKALIDQLGYQGARAAINTNGNAKRIRDEYDAYLLETGSLSSLSVGRIVESYQKSTRQQINGSLVKRSSK
jgi:hypothetical protein